MSAGTQISQLQTAQNIPDDSKFIVEMGDGSGTKVVPKEVLAQEMGNELKIGDIEELDTENKGSLVAAINEAAQSGGGGSSVDILDSKEEIEANTEDGKIAGALAMKEMFSEISDNMGGLSFYEDGDGNVYAVGADSVPKKLDSGELVTATGEFTASTTEKSIVCGFKPTHIILVNYYANSTILVQFYTPESSFIFSGGSYKAWNQQSNYLNVTLTNDGFTVKSPSQYASYKTFYYAFKAG